MFETLKIVGNYQVLMDFNERNLTFIKLMNLVSSSNFYRHRHPLGVKLNQSPNPNVTFLGRCHLDEFIEFRSNQPTRSY
jgi:hypothetical protein